MTSKTYNDRIAASKAGIEQTIRSYVEQYGAEGADVVRETLRREHNIAADPAFIDELMAARPRMAP